MQWIRTVSTTFKENQTRIIPVKFGQKPISGLGGDVVWRNCLRTEARKSVNLCLRNKSHVYGINPIEIHWSVHYFKTHESKHSSERWSNAGTHTRRTKCAHKNSPCHYVTGELKIAKIFFRSEIQDGHHGYHLENLSWTEMTTDLKLGRKYGGNL